MRRLATLILVIAAASCLYASWSITWTIDEEREPTGQFIAVEELEGLLEEEPVRAVLSAEVIDSIWPRISLNFDFSRPGEDSSPEATYVFADDDGQAWMVKEDEDWHYLPPLDARPIAQALLDGKDLTCTIIHGWDTYRLSIPSQGFRDAVQAIYENLKGELDVWTRNHDVADWIEGSPSYHTAEYTTLTTLDQGYAIVDVLVFGPPLSYSDDPEVAFYVTLLDSYDQIDLNGDLLVPLSVKISGSNGNHISTQRTGDSFYGSLDLEIDRFTDGAIFHDSETVDITLTLDDGSSFTFQMEAVPFRHEVEMVKRT